MMKRALLLCLSLFCIQFALSVVVKPNGDTEEEDPCSNVFCHAGQECVAAKGKASCECLSECPDHIKPVCGSDGVTYPNHCELHRIACVHTKKITIRSKGPCEEIPSSAPTGKVNMSKPVVCYERDRDQMRGRMIEWMQMQEESLANAAGYQRVLKRFFDMVDKNKDGKLNLKELTELVKYNQTVAEIREADEFINPVLQGLCSDALISITDDDEDTELTFKEFRKCLDPDFKPPMKNCELEGEQYKDGAEIPTDCNSCVCACGRWVCTALDCNPSSNHVKASLVLQGEQAKEKLEREVLAENPEQKRVLLLHKPSKHGMHRMHHRHERTRKSGKSG
ncbi:predicted protein [Nematostella vectensis]|uniref:Follistatin-related protein 1 n=2 Tax=Nematostella vectensis TaxID=45351 RepID=A7SIW2_NEMVE|nr:predicted protein [Nematostella vectensis]|eukprot:XP_001628435.1 predicted protein [Nematostella vectensis]